MNVTGAGARPVGAHVLKDGQVAWRPAIAVNRIIAIVGMVVLPYLLRRRRR